MRWTCARCEACCSVTRLAHVTWGAWCLGPPWRPRHRALAACKQARASPLTRLKGLLRSQGVRLTRLSKFPEQLDALRLGDGSPLPSGLRRRVLRV
jgi:hypothetical protein